jgi:hypothetical protein
MVVVVAVVVAVMEVVGVGLVEGLAVGARAQTAPQLVGVAVAVVGWGMGMGVAAVGSGMGMGVVAVGSEVVVAVVVVVPRHPVLGGGPRGLGVWVVVVVGCGRHAWRGGEPGSCASCGGQRSAACDCLADQQHLQSSLVAAGASAAASAAAAAAAARFDQRDLCFSSSYFCLPSQQCTPASTLVPASTYCTCM